MLIFHVVKFWTFVNFPITKIPKIFNLENKIFLKFNSLENLKKN